MKRTLFGLVLVLALLCGCAAQTAPPEESAVPSPDHPHPAAADNVLPHEQVGYCGNTVTEIRAGDAEASFWGSDSVALTDLLHWLDYRDDVYSCPAEYTVTTELSETPYELNLTAGFARHDGRQVSLTDEQIGTIAAILDRADLRAAEEP